MAASSYNLNSVMPFFVITTDVFSVASCSASLSPVMI